MKRFVLLALMLSACLARAETWRPAEIRDFQLNGLWKYALELTASHPANEERRFDPEKIPEDIAALFPQELLADDRYRREILMYNVWLAHLDDPRVRAEIQGVGSHLMRISDQGNIFIDQIIDCSGVLVDGEGQEISFEIKTNYPDRTLLSVNFLPPEPRWLRVSIKSEGRDIVENRRWDGTVRNFNVNLAQNRVARGDEVAYRTGPFVFAWNENRRDYAVAGTEDARIWVTQDGDRDEIARSSTDTWGLLRRLANQPPRSPANTAVWGALGLSLLVIVALIALVLFLRHLIKRMTARLKDAVRREAEEEAVLRERLRLSHDLHDNLQQLLAGTMFRLDAALTVIEDPKGAADQILGARKNLAQTQAGLRSVLWGLQEESEGPDSIVGLFTYAASRLAHWRGKVTITSTGEEPVEARRYGGRLLMVLQEAVGNALTHGRATSVSARLQFRRSGDNAFVRLVVSDTGVGFDTVRSFSGLGLVSMRQRAEEMGGSFRIESVVGKGTSVRVEVPL